MYLITCIIWHVIIMNAGVHGEPISYVNSDSVYNYTYLCEAGFSILVWITKNRKWIEVWKVKDGMRFPLWKIASQFDVPIQHKQWQPSDKLLYYTGIINIFWNAWENLIYKCNVDSSLTNFEASMSNFTDYGSCWRIELSLRSLVESIYFFS